MPPALKTIDLPVVLQDLRRTILSDVLRLLRVRHEVHGFVYKKTNDRPQWNLVKEGSRHGTLVTVSWVSPNTITIETYDRDIFDEMKRKGFEFLHGSAKDSDIDLYLIHHDNDTQ